MRQPNPFGHEWGTDLPIVGRAWHTRRTKGTKPDNPVHRGLWHTETNAEARHVHKGDLMAGRLPEADELLTPAEVAALFRVDPKTVTRWAKAGKLTSIRTLGGHRRYRAAEVRALLGEIPGQREPGEVASGT